jgi:hypothetical protein
MKSILSAVIVATGLIALSASAQAAPVSGMQTGVGTVEGIVAQVRMSPRERMMRERMMRKRAMHHRMMRRR